jgi:hypothetical protein
MRTFPPISKFGIFLRFYLVAINKKWFEAYQYIMNLQLYVDVKIWQKNWVKNIENDDFGHFCHDESKMAKNYPNITTVFPL